MELGISAERVQNGPQTGERQLRGSWIPPREMAQATPPPLRFPLIPLPQQSNDPTVPLSAAPFPPECK